MKNKNNFCLRDIFLALTRACKKIEKKEEEKRASKKNIELARKERQKKIEKHKYVEKLRLKVEYNHLLKAKLDLLEKKYKILKSSKKLKKSDLEKIEKKIKELKKKLKGL